MRYLIATIFVLSALDSALAQHIRPNASGCVATPLSCNMTARGTLAAGDCTSPSNGAFYDVYAFAGTAGQLVTVDVRPLSPALTNPLVTLVPPASDASVTPLEAGPRGVVARYVLSSSGIWQIVVGSTDLFASGDYVVRVTCNVNPSPSSPQACVPQTFLCGQALEWSLSSQSCRFSNDANRLYQQTAIYGVAGDTITITETSSAFQPLFSVYDATGMLLATSNISMGRATLTLPVTTTGYLYVIATSTMDFATGDYTLGATCSTSGCLAPIILSGPSNATATYGGTATLSVEVNATDPVTVHWTQTAPDLATLEPTGLSFTTPPLFGPAAFMATATNACGSDTSATAFVTVIPPRRRATKH